jgi:hypothetical protein
MIVLSCWYLPCSVLNKNHLRPEAWYKATRTRDTLSSLICYPACLLLFQALSWYRVSHLTTFPTCHSFGAHILTAYMHAKTRTQSPFGAGRWRLDKHEWNRHDWFQRVKSRVHEQGRKGLEWEDGI